VGVDLRIAGSAGVLAEHRGGDPVGADDDHIAVGRHARESLDIDEVDHRGNGCFVGGDYLPTNLGRRNGPEDRHDLGAEHVT
jgi:hypothetical protein